MLSDHRQKYKQVNVVVMQSFQKTQKFIGEGTVGLYSTPRFMTYRCPGMVDSTKIHQILFLPRP